MTELSKRSTVYFEPAIHQALRMKAATAHISVSDIVNETVCMVRPGRLKRI